jgi:hypothetical protein
MARCPSCDYLLPGDRERMGARCPNCRDPLYEPPGRFGRPARPDEASCTAHPGTESVGLCSRCGNYLCEVCRCRWRDQTLCAACVNRALEGGEATPEADRGHFRLALWSTVFGGGAWLLGGLAFLFVGLVGSSVTSPEQAMMVILLFFFLSLAAGAVALFGVGLGTTALRGRGGHMVLASIGTILGGLFVGGLVGVFAFAIWQV